MKKLSVIIPAYQAEAFIDKCLNSIRTNALDLEVLVVNDGSTDRTEEICRKLAEQDSRIRVWTKENGGPGAAREYALAHAQGEYITFVDADDYLEPGAYDKLAVYLDKTADIIEFGYQLVHVNGTLISQHPMISESCCGAACGEHYARQKNTTNFLWNKIFHSKLFEGLAYPHLYAGEDAALMAQLFVHADSYRTVPDVLYHYVMTPESLCRKPMSVKKLDAIRGYRFIDEFYTQNAPALSYYSRQKICSLAALLYCECVRSGNEELTSRCSELIKEFAKAREGYSLYKLLGYGSSSRRIMILLFAISPKLCAFVYTRRK